MPSDQRNLVLIIGESSLAETPFGERDLRTKRVAIQEAPSHFKDARAVVIADFPGKFGLINECYAGLFRQAEDEGLAQVVIVHSHANFNQVAAIKEIADSHSASRLFLIADTPKSAEFIARHRVGPVAGNVLIEPEQLIQSKDDVLLLRRAFGDCEKIFLEPLTGGKASMGVFRAHAWLKQSEVGPRPLPFFVKIADPNLVDAEMQKYRLYAEHYIPFNLRPNLDRRRCLHTRSRAILVGNFADDAVPLRKSLRGGHGIGALFALFETSLGGFRLQPFVAKYEPWDGALGGFVQDRIRANEIPDAIVQRARAHGLTTDPATLQSTLCDAAKRLACVFGPYHGDLHPGNVMVRGGDAILIDFSATGRGPLTADPAALEVGLMFGTDGDDKPDCLPEWRALVDQTYSDGTLTLHPSALFEARPSQFSWLRRSLRALRHVLLGCHANAEEARIVLAAYLMRFARLGAEEFSDSRLTTLATERHSYALVVAERIVKSLPTQDTIKAVTNGN